MNKREKTAETIWKIVLGIITYPVLLFLWISVIFMYCMSESSVLGDFTRQMIPKTFIYMIITVPVAFAISWVLSIVSNKVAKSFSQKHYFLIQIVISLLLLGILIAVYCAFITG